MAEHKTDIDETMKLLGAHVPASLYWAFKEAASNRKEKMFEAVCNAARLYIEIESEKIEGDK